jgi:NADPH-dependent 2,4-dienoyl-CoA reductase/sulfur reductase-like enzyme
MERGFNVHLAEAVRKVVKIPVIAVGSINDPELADSIIGSGKADLVAMGRQMLADPYFPVKAQEDRLDDIRRCIRCNECLFRVRKGLGVGCTVNPELGRESQPYSQEPFVSKRVIVIGGGPAGMAAAIAARRNGHQVTLAERNNSLGGNLALASIPKFKDELKVLLKYYTRQLEKHGVEIMLGLNMTIEKLKELSPDTVVVATGAHFYSLEGFSVDNRSVYLAPTLIENPELATGRKVAILGGGKTGCETALCLTKDVQEITIIESLDDVLEESDYWESVVIKRMLDAREIRLILRSTVQGFDGKTLTIVDNTFKRTTLEIDALILAVGMKPEENFLAEMARCFPDAHLVGDCIEPRNLFSAIHEGSAVGRRI